MVFVPKVWENLPSTSTPISATELNRIEQGIIEALAGGTASVEEWRSGATAPAGSLGNQGDWYINTATADIYEKTGATTWTLRANIKGDPGTDGTDGTNGTASTVPGPPGPAGVTVSGDAPSSPSLGQAWVKPLTAPVANFSVTPATGAYPVTVTVTPSPAGLVNSISINWGDGSAVYTDSSAPFGAVTHDYITDNGGVPFTISMTATGPGGTSSAFTREVAVTPPPGGFPSYVTFTGLAADNNNCATPWDSGWAFATGFTMVARVELADLARTFNYIISLYDRLDETQKRWAVELPSAATNKINAARRRASQTTGISSSTSTVGLTGLTANQPFWIKIIARWAPGGSATVDFSYNLTTSQNEPTSWTALGAQVLTTGELADATDPLIPVTVGASSIFESKFKGKIYYVRMSDGTVTKTFNPHLAPGNKTSGQNFTSDGTVWTLDECTLTKV